jgi:hypothetical protein
MYFHNTVIVELGTAKRNIGDDSVSWLYPQIHSSLSKRCLNQVNGNCSQ